MRGVSSGSTSITGARPPPIPLPPSICASGPRWPRNRCRDNNFGRYIGSSIRTVAPDTEPQLNDRIYDGQRTWVLEIADADVGDDAYAPGRLWGVRDERSTGVAIKWDGTDVRMATDESVTEGNLEKPIITFPKGYIVGDTWVSGEDEDHTFLLPMSNKHLIPVHLRHSTFAVALDPDRANGHDGTLAGVFDRDAMIAMIDELVRYADQCPGSVLYMNQVTAATNAFDVSYDAPSLQDSNKPCDGLSAGIGFDMRAVQPLVGVAPPRTPPADLCGSSDAGTD